MFHSKYAHKYFRSASALIIGVVLAVAIWSTYTRQPAKVASDPQAGVAEASGSSEMLPARRMLDLGAGYRLEMDEQGGQVIAPFAPLKDQPANAAGNRSIDLGAGYKLVLTDNDGQIVAPAHPSTYFKRMDLGGGYVLEMNGESGEIIAPQTVVKSETAGTKRIDLGAGYQLVLTGNTGQIIPPASPVLAQPQASGVHKVDLGAGYILELDDSGGQIVAPTTPFEELPATSSDRITSVISLGNGYISVVPLKTAIS